MRKAVVWGLLISALGVPIALAANSPLLAWRDPIYIAAGFAGIIAMGLVLVQPLLAAGVVPNISPKQSRRLHGFTGGLLVFGVIGHVVGLWITSPPDVLDALMFASPTPFSVWGVIAMWAVFVSALLAMLRQKLGLRLWRLMHSGLVCVIVIGTCVHAVQIEGTMEPISKGVLSVLILAATFWALGRFRV